MRPYVIQLEDRPAEVGWKGARLARVRELGFAVPDGVVVGAGAFRAFLEGSGLGSWRDQVVDALHDGRDPGELVAEHRRRAAGAAIPGEVAGEVRALVEDLLTRYPRLVLRSSTSMEDLASASMSGVFTSRGGLAGPDAALAALREIWVDALAPSTLAVLLDHGLDPRDLRVAVLVQEHLDLQVAGACTSIDPRRPREGPLIQLVRGDAAPLMDGRVAADPELATSRRDRLALVDRALRDGLGEGPLDLELGWDPGDRLVILQARPLVLDPAMRTDVRWGRSLTRERYPLPLSPLAWDNIRRVFVQGIEGLRRFLGMGAIDPDAVACRIAGRLHANEDLFAVREAVDLRLSPGAGLRLLGATAWRWGRRGCRPGDLRELAAWLGAPKATRSRLGDRPDSLVAFLATRFVVLFLEERCREGLAGFEGDVARFRGVMKRVEEGLGEFGGAAGPGGGGAGGSGEGSTAEVERLRGLAGELRVALEDFLRTDLVIYGAKQVCFETLEAMFELAGRPVDREEWIRALGGMTGNPTSALVGEAASLGEVLRREGAASEAYREARARFLATHGHLTTSWDMADPILAEVPEVVDALAAAAEGTAPRAAAGEGRAALAHAMAGAGELEHAFAELAARLEHLMLLDERHHLETLRVVAPSRRLVRILGGFLAARGVLPDPDDVFFLEDAEVWRALERPGSRLDALVRRRRRAHARYLAAGEPGELAAAPGARVFEAAGASAGRARGPVRRVASLRDAAGFAEGEVLVVRTPDPLWTMLYPRAAALVSETGALLSHGVVTAREFGLPAVIGATGAFAALRDGEEVEVDGTAGRVRAAAGDAPL